MTTVDISKLPLIKIDFDHLVTDNLPAMCDYLVPYFNQGKGKFKLKPLGITPDGKVLPKLKEGNYLLGLKQARTVTISKEKSVTELATEILKNYRTWLKTRYQEQKTGSTEDITSLITTNPNTMLFTPRAYTNFVVSQLAKDDVCDLNFEYLRRDHSDIVMTKLLTKLKSMTEIDVHLVNTILDYINDVTAKTVAYDQQAKPLVNFLYQVLLGRTTITINYDAIFSSWLTPMFTKYVADKIELPVSTFSSNTWKSIRKLPITIVITNADDLQYFVSMFWQIHNDELQTAWMRGLDFNEETGKLVRNVLDVAYNRTSFTKQRQLLLQAKSKAELEEQKGYAAILQSLLSLA